MSFYLDVETKGLTPEPITADEARKRVNAIIKASKQRGADFEQLAADEFALNREILESILANADYTTRVVDLAKQALRLAKSEHPRW